MFSFFRKKSAPEASPPPSTAPVAPDTVAPVPAVAPAMPVPVAPAPAPSVQPVSAPKVPATEADAPARSGWMQRLKSGLSKTGNNIADVFTGGTQIDEALYEELETALLMADTGVAATTALLNDLRQRVKDQRATAPAQVKALLAEAIADMLAPLEKPLVVGEYRPTVIMVAGVNGAGKTTTIGKLTRHLASGGATVLLAAADTFRAAAREQLAVWAGRNRVEIISQDGADPSAVSFDAVAAGRARREDVVLIDTAGRLPTQKHLMEELTKIRRVVAKAGDGTTVESLLVLDAVTGQNAIQQAAEFIDAAGATGIILTKLDGTAKGGVVFAVKRELGIPVKFIGVGEGAEDLQPFSGADFVRAMFERDGQENAE